MTDIKISIIIPIYNRDEFIGRCIRSILSQSIDRKNYEIIIIDDGSTDYSSKIYNVFADEVIIIKHKKNLGLPTALNTGIKKAKGRYVVRLDSDDYVNHDFLHILMIFLSENKNFDAVACDYLLVDDQEKVLKRMDCNKYPIGCGIMFKTEHLIEIGLYDEKFLLHEERELRQRFEKKYKITSIPLPLYRYRKHEANMTNDKKNYKKKFKLLQK
jgi:glycosyltransferase involved in cell wall biosynthesis